MELPVKNKEVLADKDITTISKTKLRIYIISGIFSLLGLLVTTSSDTFTKWVTSEEKLLLKDAEYKMKLQIFIDSIQRVEDIKTQERTYRNISRINDLMNDLRKELPNSSLVTLYYTHDSGGVPVSGSSINATVLFASNNSTPYLGKSYWQNKVVPEGYFNFTHLLYLRNLLYIPNVELNEDIYIGDTKDDLLRNGTKALLGIVIKDTGYGVYFLSIAWNEPYPITKNPNAILTLRKYAHEITPLIEPKKTKR